jgi:nicotinate-nucleotide adenylyltransferase
MSQRIALFGGTFDPIHRGHVTVIRAALDALDLEQVILVPSAVPPHKRGRQLAPGEHRLAMCRLAAKADPRLVVSDVELRQTGPSYTVSTLQAIASEHADAELLLIIGADMLRDFHLWHRAEEIARLAQVVTLPRPEVELGRLAELRQRIGDAAVDEMLGRVLPTPLVEISSTDIRNRLASGKPIDDLVPPDVGRYIVTHGLYC